MLLPVRQWLEMFPQAARVYCNSVTVLINAWYTTEDPSPRALVMEASSPPPAGPPTLSSPCLLSGRQALQRPATLKHPFPALAAPRPPGGRTDSDPWWHSQGSQFTWARPSGFLEASEGY